LNLLYLIAQEKGEHNTTKKKKGDGSIFYWMRERYRENRTVPIFYIAFPVIVGLNSNLAISV